MTDRGRADSVSVEGDVDPPAGTEYRPDEHAIRYVARIRAGDEDPPERESAYETRPFEDWATTEGAKLGRDRIAGVVESRLDKSRGVSIAWGLHPDEDAAGDDRTDDGRDSRDRTDSCERHGLAVTVDRWTGRDRDGKVVSEADVGYDDLRDATPESVTATVRFSGRTHTETFPVVVREETDQSL
ncbi:hypothetical protein [Halorussus sp. AFM4]|uniref:hypothetical protein n=1 Tax=Halorussus sp. AFM4 TaxID=3421651 RepID=UPI003EB9FC53